MCGRFVTLSREEVARVVASIEANAQLPALESVEGRAQAFPGSVIDAIGAPEGSLAIGSFSWGFPVEWNKKPVFNTRIESALSGRGMWRDIVESGRCVVPAAAFFEPHATETVRSPRTGRMVKQAYEFADEAGTPLLMAGLTDGAHCSIVTTEPNNWVRPVHNRMPLVLRFEEVPLWLTGGLTDVANLADRSSLPLAVAPESLSVPGSSSSTPDQLTLF